MADGKTVDLMETNQIIFRSISSNVWYFGKVSVPRQVVQDLQFFHKINASVCHFHTAYRRRTVKCDVLSSFTTNVTQKQHNGFPTFINYGRICLHRPHYVPWLWAAIAQSVKRLTTDWTVRGSNPSESEIFRCRSEWSWAHPISYTMVSGSLPG